VAFERNNFYVLTGGSGGGKSSIIDALRARGHLCVDEVGRSIVKEQLRIGGDGTPWQNPQKFCELALSRAIFVYEQTAERERPVFFDRGIVEGVGASRQLGLATEHYRNAARIYRYAPKAFVTPPWKEIFTNDPERPYSFEFAIEDYRSNVAAYRECGYELIELPKAPISDRVDFILRELSIGSAET